MKAFVKATLLVVGLLIFLVNLYVNVEDDDNDGVSGEDVVLEEIGECEELSKQDSVHMVVVNGRSWKEYLNDYGFCSSYHVSYRDFDDAAYSRNNLYVQYWSDDSDYWRQVYSQLYLDSKDRLQSIQDSLLSIRDEWGLDREDFARVVVAFVQDIPYEYVVPEECKGDETAPCNGNVSMGIYSPVEFLGAMHGDCDTRTVLLFTLLKNFGYEPLILNSNEYAHSILALDVKSAGEDFEYKGRRYAYWETTNVGWLAGMLPPDMNNKDYWSVALDYEL